MVMFQFKFEYRNITIFRWTLSFEAFVIFKSIYIYDPSKNPADVLPRKTSQNFSDKSYHVMHSRFFCQFVKTFISIEKSVRKWRNPDTSNSQKYLKDNELLALPFDKGVGILVGSVIFWNLPWVHTCRIVYRLRVLAFKSCVWGTISLPIVFTEF